MVGYRGVSGLVGLEGSTSAAEFLGVPGLKAGF